jgi:hypothetical protein
LRAEAVLAMPMISRSLTSTAVTGGQKPAFYGVDGEVSIVNGVNCGLTSSLRVVRATFRNGAATRPSAIPGWFGFKPDF